MSWLPDFAENFEIEKHIKYSIKTIEFVIKSPVLRKLETLKIYFLYCSVSTLYLLNSTDKLKNKDKILKFLQKALTFQNSEI